MSTYLQLCVDARRECGIAGSGPTTVLAQSGEFERLVAWVRQGWVEVQNRCPSWRWMRSRFTLATVAATASYAPAAAVDVRSGAAVSRFKRWWWEGGDAIWIHLVADGAATERRLIPLPWRVFKDRYQVGAPPADGYPVNVSVDEQDNLVLGPRPNAVYSARGDFQRSAQVLAADGDVPDFRADYHQLLVYEAMKKYAGYESAPEVMTRAVVEGNRLMRQLEAEQMPRYRLGGPLA